MADISDQLASRVRRNAVGSFLALAFGGAWLLWGYWVFAMPPGGLQVSAVFMACALLGGAAPSLASLLITWAQEGRDGVANLMAPIGRWRVGAAAFVISLLFVPAATALATLALILVGAPVKAGDVAGLIPIALAWPMMAALGEEIGWRGFLLPKLANAFGGVGAAFAVGLFWGMWHLPADWIGLKAYGAWFPAIFLINGPLLLTAHSIIMTWLWRRTGGSLLISLLYHWSITASAILAPAPARFDAAGVGAAAISVAPFVLGAGLLLAVRARDFARR